MNEENLPIDIHYNKLLDWLISRRHCPQQWQSKALMIREKINTAIQDMPPVEEITKLLTGTYINYFHCLKIVELLKVTDDGAKNILGQYSSQRMKDWQEIIKLYEKEGVNLAEAAQMLMRNVNYEIPALKKQIAKCQQAQQECTRKESDFASNAAELRQKYLASCKQMGIEGKKVKRELLELVKDMPSTYNQIAQDASLLKQGFDYYAVFLTFTLNNPDLGSQCLPLLRHIMAKGNTTTYEFRMGQAPTHTEPTLLDYSLAADEDQQEEKVQLQDNELQIDFGDLGTEEIDFDISLEDGGQELGAGDPGAGIDFGDTTDLGAHIDIELVADSTADLPPANEPGVARGDDALTLLDNTAQRNAFVDELYELEAFLSQRLQELSVCTDVLSSSQFQAAPSSLQVDAKQMGTMVGAVRAVLSQLTSTNIQELLLIRSSPRYVDRLAESLKKILIDSEKALSLSRLMVTRRQEAVAEQQDLEPRVDLLRQRTRELQRHIEVEISKKYKKEKSTDGSRHSC